MSSLGSNHFYKSRNSNKIRNSSVSSTKRFANRLSKYIGNPTDKSHKIIYQIDKDGTIVRIWKNFSEIAEFFKVPAYNVRYAVNNNKIVADCLFVKMLDYKTTIDYKVLIKYYKFVK